MKRIGLSLLYVILFQFIASGQIDTLRLPYQLDGEDTLAVYQLEEVSIIAPFSSASSEDAKRLAKLVRMVKRVYPYARLAGIRFQELNQQIDSTTSKSERKRIIHQIESEIKEKYGDELKKLTFSQGKILIKLIDRQTGSSTYDVVKDFRGSFMAFFYQNFARVWGYNLRTKYDPTGEDRDIELIVRMIEKGYI